MLTGKHCIGGVWTTADAFFKNQPVEGAPDKFFVGTAELVDCAARCAEEAFSNYSQLPRWKKACFLRQIALEIDNAGGEITSIGMKETGLPKERLVGERARTVDQLNLFAAHIEKGDYLDIRHDPAIAKRMPNPRPDLKLIQRPLGPVAVFGASNFPLAFSVAGGDTASALAAGCPVIVKGHSSHPGVCDLVAQAVCRAVEGCGVPPGVFSLIQGGDRSVGVALVQHPLIKGVGFTGSKKGGRALFDLCAAREEPIPFFGELGSVNPMFVLRNALCSRGGEIATGWVKSLTMGAGQFCTNPGIVILPDGKDAKAFIDIAIAALKTIPPQIMLSDAIAAAYCNGYQKLKTNPQVKAQLATDDCYLRAAIPQLLSVDAGEWLADEALGEEVFGPLGLIVLAKDDDQIMGIANRLQGQLTCALHIDNNDMAQAKELVPILERKAGRLLVNDYPTGVEVCDSMVHGGPYPASTNFGATSVGTMAIRRFLRPICYQGFPEALLPDDLKRV